MSSAVPARQPAGGSGYEVARPQGRCAVCGEAIVPEARFMAALQETPAGFQRLDCSMECWPRLERKDVVAFWQTTMPRPEARKKVFLDDEVLCDLFARLAEVAEPAKVNFRFVLGLILMRKRLLIYDATRVENGKEVWSVRLRGREQALDLVNPKLDEQQVQDVSQQLGQILNEEL